MTAAQLMTHYANDYFDLEADRANRTPTRWSGGSRVLPDGVLPPGVALARGAGAGLDRARRGAGAGDARAPTGRCCCRSRVRHDRRSPGATARRRCGSRARGLGELDHGARRHAAAFRCSATTCRRASSRRAIFAACLLPCALQFAMLLAIELPDAAGDAVAGKRTLVVRLGAAAGARLYAALTIAGFGALPLLARRARCRRVSRSRRCRWRRSRSGRRRAWCAAATPIRRAGRASRSGRWRCSPAARARRWSRP